MLAKVRGICSCQQRSGVLLFGGIGRWGQRAAPGGACHTNHTHLLLTWAIGRHVYILTHVLLADVSPHSAVPLISYLEIGISCLVS